MKIYVKSISPKHSTTRGFVILDLHRNFAFEMRSEISGKHNKNKWAKWLQNVILLLI